jgi:aryl-alcohol dehydrogenase-like predicted oxidoreductase
LQNTDVSSVILGATKTAQLNENLDALENSHKLTAEVSAAIEKIMDNTPEPEQAFQG